jgi:hypothetical protein
MAISQRLPTSISGFATTMKTMMMMTEVSWRRWWCLPNAEGGEVSWVAGVWLMRILRIGVDDPVKLPVSEKIYLDDPVKFPFSESKGERMRSWSRR